MVYEVTKDIKLMGTGNYFWRGQTVGDAQIPEPIRSNLIKEGVLVKVKEPAPKKAPAKKEG